MVKLPADMASFNDEDPSEMLERLRSGVRTIFPSADRLTEAPPSGSASPLAGRRRSGA
jgi:hypothetical protein